MKKIVKIPGVIIIVLILLVVIIRLILSLAAVKIANRELPGILNTEASVGSISLGLLRGYVSIKDLRIAQPEGFGEGDLLLVPEFSLKVKFSSLYNPPLIVEEVTLTDWEVNIVKNADGVMNIDVIHPVSSPEPGPTAIPERGIKPEGEEESPAKPILIRKLSIKNLSCSYTDHAVGLELEEAAEEAAEAEFTISTDGEGEEIIITARLEESTDENVESGLIISEELDKDKDVLRVKIASLDLLITNLLIDPEADPELVEPAQALLTARIIQEPFTDGLLGLHAVIGPIGGGLPIMNAVIRLNDLELEPIAVVVPDGTAQILGGSAIDLSVDLVLASYILDCEIEVEASGGHIIPLAIGGTPDEPKIDTSSILFGVMLHLGGRAGSLVGNVGGAGYQVGAAASETTWAVGKGVTNVVGSISGGLFKTVTNAATGDLDGAMEGLSDTTVGTVNEAGAAAGDVAGEVAEGATATADSTTGEDADREWRADTPNRFQKSWDEALEIIDGMTFPPPHRDDDDTLSPSSPEEEDDNESVASETPGELGEFNGAEPF